MASTCPRIRTTTILPLVLTATSLCGCLTSVSPPEVPTTIDGRISLTGSVGDGPVVDASMRLLGNDGSQLMSFVSDTYATYEISVAADTAIYPLTIDATGGTDLVTNLAPDFRFESAVPSPGTAGIANLNPFTTIAVALARELNGGLDSGNLATAEEIVASQLNCGLDSLARSGAMTTLIDESNIAEIVKASETLGELARRVRDLLNGAGYLATGDDVIAAIASDLTDDVVDGRGGTRADERVAAIVTLVHAQVLMESMANEVHVNGADATAAMNQAITQVVPGSPTDMIGDQLITSGMIRKTRIGLAAAFAVNQNPAIQSLHGNVSELQPGMNAATARSLMASNYRSTLQSTLSMIASADAPTIDIVNQVARGDGAIAPANENRAPVISGSPAGTITAGNGYSFTPTVSDPDGDTLTFSVTNQPTWANFDTATGTLSGTPGDADVGSFSNIRISVSDGSLSDSLAAFAITVNDAGSTNSAPTISGSPAGSVTAGQTYSFAPTASDPDGDTLTFSIANRPAWASFDSVTGTLSGTPGDANVGSFSNIRISVSDGSLSDSLAPFAIDVEAVSLGSLTVSWTPPTRNEDGSTLNDLAGYKFYWGTPPDNYTGTATVDNPGISSHVIENLAPGTYEFVVTSYSAAGVESRFSDPATASVP